VVFRELQGLKELQDQQDHKELVVFRELPDLLDLKEYRE
jgi:hypothetical protein